jgi:hypothetical protein
MEVHLKHWKHTNNIFKYAILDEPIKNNNFKS